MAPTVSTFDEQKFGEAMLERVLEFVIEHYDPTELYGSEAIKQHVQDEYEPGDLFDHLEIVEDSDFFQIAGPSRDA